MTATPMPAEEDSTQSPEEELLWAVEAELAWHDGDAKAAIADLALQRALPAQAVQPGLAMHGRSIWAEPIVIRQPNSCRHRARYS